MDELALLYITAPFSQFIETSGEAPGTTDEIIKRAEKAIEIAKKYDKNDLKLEDLKANLATYHIIRILRHSSPSLPYRPSRKPHSLLHSPLCLYFL